MSTKMLGTLEQKIMDVLWVSPKSLKPAEVLCLLGDRYAYTTIMTELKRMSDKKILKRQLIGKAYVYAPAKCKAEFSKTCLCGLFTNVVDSYGSLAITQFVDALKTNPKDLDILKKYLQDAQK